MLKSTLGWNFFGLSSKYSQHMLDEFFYLSKSLHMQYSEFLKVPTYARKYLIQKLIDDANPNKIG